MMCAVPKQSKKRFTVFLVIILVAGIVAVKVWVDYQRGALSHGASARLKGNPHAPLKIVEFIDFQCPACAAGTKYLNEVMEKNPDLIQLELKYFPLAMHRHGYLSSWFAQCALEQGKFWPFVEKMLERQQQWQGLADARSAFDAIAMELGFDDGKLQACLIDNKTHQAVEKMKEEGRTLGISSTPTYFVNGKMVVGMKSLETEITSYQEGRKH